MRDLSNAGCDRQRLVAYAYLYVTNNDESRRWRRECGPTLKSKLNEGIKGARQAAEAYKSLAEIYERAFEQSRQMGTKGWSKGFPTAPDLQLAASAQAERARAESVEQAARDLEKKRASCAYVFNEKRLGVAGEWMPLVMLQEYARASTGKTLTARELAHLIEAAAFALGLEYLKVDADLLHRNIKNFRKRNPHVISQAAKPFSAQQSPPPGNQPAN